MWAFTVVPSNARRRESESQMEEMLSVREVVRMTGVSEKVL